MKLLVVARRRGGEETDGGRVSAHAARTHRTYICADIINMPTVAVH